MNEIIMENAWHTTKDMAAMLGIETVTVRKYALALEKAGYIISRDDKDRRTYSDVDAMALQQLFTLRERSGMTVEKSAEMVASNFWLNRPPPLLRLRRRQKPCLLLPLPLSWMKFLHE
ncbi:hypothetical protein P7H12_01920 [Paenibacillus larvae]|nr:hypothetical protein [Paenibacillus larvae]MDT2262665.1 hypothetical protein [Paenibacillus larvae]